LTIPITILATVGVINAINMSDGIDGLSSGVVLIALVMLSIAAMAAGQRSIIDFIQILIASLLAFLTFNFRLLWQKSALVFLGDAGTALLGFMVAWLLISATQGDDAFIAPVSALWFLAVPLMDTVALLIGRPLQRRSPFKPARDHLHHRLMDVGLSAKQTVFLIYGLALACGLIGLIGHFSGASEALMFIGFLSLFILYLQVSRRFLS